VQAEITAIFPESTVMSAVPSGTFFVPVSLSVTPPEQVVVAPKVKLVLVQVSETVTDRVPLAEACWGIARKPAAAITSARTATPKRRAGEAEHSALAVNLCD